MLQAVQLPKLLPGVPLLMMSLPAVCQPGSAVSHLHLLPGVPSLGWTLQAVQPSRL
jgi:hypothetical protein